MFNFKGLIAVAVLVLGGISAVSAQDGSGLKVNVPHAFVINEEMFAAGDYTIERTPSTADSPSLMVIRGEGESMIFDTMAARTSNAAEATELVFDSINGTYFLSKITVKGATTAVELAKTRSQVEAADWAKAVTIAVTSFNGF